MRITFFHSREKLPLEKDEGEALRSEKSLNFNLIQHRGEWEDNLHCSGPPNELSNTRQDRFFHSREKQPLEKDEGEALRREKSNIFEKIQHPGEWEDNLHCSDPSN